MKQHDDGQVVCGCGGAVKIERKLSGLRHAPRTFFCYQLRCQGCGLSYLHFVDDQAEAIDGWNRGTRATADALLREAVDLLSVMYIAIDSPRLETEYEELRERLNAYLEAKP